MIPKVELHCHIEGAAPPELVRRLGKKYGVDLSRLFDQDGQYQWDDFTTFLQAYDVASSVFRRPEDYEDLAFVYFTKAAIQGAIYCEIFISSDHAEKSGLSYEAYVDGLARGIEKAKSKTGIEGRMIATGVRHFGEKAVERAAQLAVDFPHPLVTGFGMGGDERHGHPSNFTSAFRIAQEAGLQTTAHAGEFGGPESVSAALDFLKINRVGHGVRSIEDPKLVDRIVDEDIVLELCPGSNIALGLYEALRFHPINLLRRAGVRVTVSSDDPPFFHTSIGDEYDQLAKTFDWDAAQLRDISRTALDAAFCDEVTRERLRKKFNNGASNG